MGWSSKYGRMTSHGSRLCVAASLQGPKFRSDRRKKLPVDLGGWWVDPGTLNTHFLMEVWWNNHSLCNDLESSTWNNHKKTCCCSRMSMFQLLPSVPQLDHPGLRSRFFSSWNGRTWFLFNIILYLNTLIFGGSSKMRTWGVECTPSISKKQSHGSMIVFQRVDGKKSVQILIFHEPI